MKIPQKYFIQMSKEFQKLDENIKNEISKQTDKNCIYCKKKLQKNSTKNFHLKCIIINEKIIKKSNIITVCYNREENIVYL